MSSTTTRRVSAALAVTALLVLPASPAVATVRRQGLDRTALGFFAQSWRFLADLLGTPAGAAPASTSTATPAPGRHGLTSRHSDLGGFIDPDGARLLSHAPGTPVGTP